nr:MAG TPA: hypothetical protein [Caudoviricetes sp.]
MESCDEACDVEQTKKELCQEISYRRKTRGKRCGH